MRITLQKLRKFALENLRWLPNFKPGEHTALIIQAFIIGILAGLLNIAFRSTMEFVNNVIFKGGSTLLGVDQGGLHLLLVPLLPMAGALLLIPLSKGFPGQVNGYGFPQFLETVNIKGGVIKLRNILLKTLAPALTIGSGGSAGVEGPIAIIGGTVGSGVGQLFKVSGNRMRLLIAAGCAGGIAATFNAPIAGVMFAMEIVLLGNYELASFSAIVIASGIATVISRGHYGAFPAFPVPQYDLVSMYEIPLYMILGLIVGTLAVLYIRIFYGVRKKFDNLKLHPQLKPVFGAFIVGCIGIFLPQIMGNGYEFIEDALSGKIILPVIFLLIFFKMGATAVTLGSGGAGGVFAPALFIGAMTGGTFGLIVHALFPVQTASAGAYATVGIGSFLSAATHAPLTGIFLLFEMTGNYKIIIPLMFASIIGTLVAKRLKADSIDTEELTQKGIRIHAGREVAIMSSVKVKDVLHGDIPTVHEHTTLYELIELMIEKERYHIPVINEKDEMVGIVSIQDVRPVMFDEDIKRIVRAVDIATEKVITLGPYDNLNTAMEKFSLKDIDEIPVVDVLYPRKVIGMVSRRDVISAYNKEVLKKQVH
ncbi:MAG TPA: Cl- channel voltage-gated family protein [Nitrospiraceae bacterium]|nr:Cl- channel voltage-gated family protein [Nitrospiraceae bacterium]